MHRRQPRQPPQLSSRSLRQHTILHWRGDVRLVVGSPQAQVLHGRIFKRLQALAQTQWPYVLGSAHSHAWWDHNAEQRHCALPVVMWDHVASAVHAREPRRSGTTPTQQHSRSSEAGNALARDGCGRRTTPAVSQPGHVLHQWQWNGQYVGAHAVASINFARPIYTTPLLARWLCCAASFPKFARPLSFGGRSACRICFYRTWISVSAY